MKKACQIIGAGEFDAASFRRLPESFLIACDGGLAPLEQAGIRPDLVVGDFDSLGYVPSGYEVIRHPVEKDDTDTMLAVKTALSRGYTRIEIYGGTGGRLDHTLANVQTLSYIALHGGIGFLLEGRQVLTVLCDGNVTFSSSCKGLLSVFSLSDRCTGVTLGGVHYPLHDAVLQNTFPLGVSNAFEGKANVRFIGMAALYWQGIPDEMEENA